jgi:hypothetical protein
MSLNGNGNGNHPRWWQSFVKKRGARADEDLSGYRRLALQLHCDLPRATGNRSALLVPPAGSKLCARTCITLASCLAEQLAQSVLLVDACPASPETTRLLGCPDQPGLSDFLANPTASLHDLVMPTTADNVRFLSAGTTRPLVYENIPALVTTAEREHDFVLLCGQSVLSDALVLALTPSLGCVLLVVTENETRVEDLDMAQSALGYCKARKVGMLLTTPRPGTWSH